MEGDGVGAAAEGVGAAFEASELERSRVETARCGGNRSARVKERRDEPQRTFLVSLVVSFASLLRFVAGGAEGEVELTAAGVGGCNPGEA